MDLKLLLNNFGFIVFQPPYSSDKIIERNL